VKKKVVFSVVLNRCDSTGWISQGVQSGAPSYRQQRRKCFHLGCCYCNFSARSCLSI